MHQLLRRDLVRDLDRRPDVVVHKLMEHKLMDHLSDMDQKMMVHRCRPYVVDSFLVHLLRQDEEYSGALQNQVEPNRDEDQTFRDAHLVHRLVFVVDAVLRHQLKMDYCQDVVDGVPKQMCHQLKMDYCQDVALQALHLLQEFLHLWLKQVL